MLLDKQSEFSDAQAITSTAASTNHIDLKNVANRVGKPLRLAVRIPTLFTTGDAATLTVQIRESATAAMAAPVVIGSTAAIAVADLVAGAEIEVPQLPKKTARYIDVNYVVGTGTFTAGNIDANLVEDEQTNGYAAMKEQQDAGAV
ncbi:MAG: hypothetical protein KAV87_02385 [Desulfobacteraceae bacterium]|nr:hypothetical protein [Desulfobacteraceae bacterium]